MSDTYPVGLSSGKPETPDSIEPSIRVSSRTYSAAPLGELAQAKIRCAMNLALVALALLACHLQPSLELRLVGYTFLFTSISAITLLFWAKLIARRAANDPWRIGQRGASIILDNVGISWILYFGDQTLAGVFALYLWTTIGYGVRYGPRYLYAGVGASLAGFAMVISASEFWQAFPALALGLSGGLLVVPLYAGYLIRLLYGALARAESAARAKADFVAKMSHELRTPLHGVIALTELLANDMSDEQRLDMMRLIRSSSNTLLDLINRILDSSKYESGSFVLQIEEMELHRTMAQTLDILLPQANAKGLSLSLFVDPRIEHQLMGSPRQIQEVIINLAGNAVKFTSEGGVRIAALAAGTPRDREAIVLSVVDTGPGMEQDYLTRVFDPFSQADDSVTRQHDGSGLGTTIARDLIQLMDGNIVIKSAPGVGTRIDVELRLPHQPARPTPDFRLPQQVVVTGFGYDSGPIRDLLKTFPTLEILEVGIGELHRQLHLMSTKTCFVIDCGTAETVMPMLREQIARKGRQSIPIVFGFGPEEQRPIAFREGLTSFLTPDSDRHELHRAFHLAAQLFSEDEPIVEPDAPAMAGLILIAEDNSTNQLIARMTLERAGYRCHVVSDGERALDELQTGAYDLAMIDMHMPELDGLDVARLYNFAAADDPSRTPIVMVTADNRPDLVADADLVGIAKFAIKPLRPSQLIQTVQDLMARRHNVMSEPTAEPSVGELVNVLVDEPEVDDELFEELLGYMELDEARGFYKEFEEDARGFIDVVRRAMDGGVGATKMRNAMHSLCGASRTVGAQRLATLSRQIEYTSERDERFNCRTFAVELDDALKAAVAGFQQRLDNVASSDNAKSGDDPAQ